MRPLRDTNIISRPADEDALRTCTDLWGLNVHINIADVVEKEMRVKRTGEKLSFAKSMSDAFGLRRLLVHQELLLPGRRASGFHFHSKKEEIFYVLTGTPSLLVGDRVTDLGPGDFIGFAASEETPHIIFNRSAEPATVLTIETPPPTDETTYIAQETFNPLPAGRG